LSYLCERDPERGGGGSGGTQRERERERERERVIQRHRREREKETDRDKEHKKHNISPKVGNPSNLKLSFKTVLGLKQIVNRISFYLKMKKINFKKKGKMNCINDFHKFSP
jgi:hypothetical protein